MYEYTKLKIENESKLILKTQNKKLRVYLYCNSILQKFDSI